MPGRYLAAVASMAVILALTLIPMPGPGPQTTPGQELVGFRGVADAIANVLLFVPFGAAVALLWRWRAAPFLAAAALSIAIELLQLAIPGRYSSPADIVCNAIGGAAGGLLIQHAAPWLRPSPGFRRLLLGSALTAALLVIAGSVFLFQPDVPELALYGQWTPVFENMAAYEGRVVAASVGAIDVGSHRIRESAALRSALLRGDTVRVRFIAGPPPARLAPIFSIFDRREREILLLGARGTDAVVEMRKRATPARFDERDLRVRHAFADVPPGRELELRFYRRQRGFCLELEQQRWCDLGFTVGDGWGLLLYPVPRALSALLPYLWLAALTFPAGFWSRSRLQLGAAAALILGLLWLAPRLGEIMPTPLPQYLAAAVGLAAGAALGHAAAQPPRPDADARTEQ